MDAQLLQSVSHLPGMAEAIAQIARMPPGTSGPASMQLMHYARALVAQMHTQNAQQMVAQHAAAAANQAAVRQAAARHAANRQAAAAQAGNDAEEFEGQGQEEADEVRPSLQPFTPIYRYRTPCIPPMTHA